MAFVFVKFRTQGINRFEEASPLNEPYIERTITKLNFIDLTSAITSNTDSPHINTRSYLQSESHFAILNYGASIKTFQVPRWFFDTIVCIVSVTKALRLHEVVFLFRNTLTHQVIQQLTMKYYDQLKAETHINGNMGRHTVSRADSLETPADAAHGAIIAPGFVIPQYDRLMPLSNFEEQSHTESIQPAPNSSPVRNQHCAQRFNVAVDHDARQQADKNVVYNCDLRNEGEITQLDEEVGLGSWRDSQHDADETYVNKITEGRHVDGCKLYIQVRLAPRVIWRSLGTELHASRRDDIYTHEHNKSTNETRDAWHNNESEDLVTTIYYTCFREILHATSLPLHDEGQLVPPTQGDSQSLCGMNRATPHTSDRVEVLHSVHQRAKRSTPRLMGAVIPHTQSRAGGELIHKVDAYYGVDAIAHF